MLVALPLFAVERRGGVLISSGLATMGFALPAAIAAALVHPRATVLCLIGDGGLGMCLAELETVARLGLRVVVVVLNDAALSLIEIKQRGRGARRRAAPCATRRSTSRPSPAASGSPRTSPTTRRRSSRRSRAVAASGAGGLVDAARRPGGLRRRAARDPRLSVEERGEERVDALRLLEVREVPGARHDGEARAGDLGGEALGVGGRRLGVELADRDERRRGDAAEAAAEVVRDEAAAGRGEALAPGSAPSPARPRRSRRAARAGRRRPAARPAPCSAGEMPRREGVEPRSRASPRPSSAVEAERRRR